MYCSELSHSSDGEVAKDKGLTGTLVLLLCYVFLYSQ